MTWWRGAGFRRSARLAVRAGAGRPARPRTRRGGLLALLVLLAVTVPGAPAQAHADLLESSPASLAEVAGPVRAVTLRFDSLIQASSARVAVRGPGGADVVSGPARVTAAAVTAALRSDQPAGDYRVTYWVTGDDGHVVSGVVRYTLTRGRAAAGSGTRAPGAPPDSGAAGQAGLVVGVTGAAALLLLIAVVLVGRRRGLRG